MIKKFLLFVLVIRYLFPSLLKNVNLKDMILIVLGYPNVWDNLILIREMNLDDG